MTATITPIMIEAIKLIEAGLAQLCDEVWVVTSPESEQVKRLVATRGLSESDALLRARAQPPQAEKVKAAHVALDNSGSQPALLRQVEAEWRRIQAKLKPAA